MMMMADHDAYTEEELNASFGRNSGDTSDSIYSDDGSSDNDDADDELVDDAVGRLMSAGMADDASGLNFECDLSSVRRPATDPPSTTSNNLFDTVFGCPLGATDSIPVARDLRPPPSPQQLPPHSPESLLLNCVRVVAAVACIALEGSETNKWRGILEALPSLPPYVAQKVLALLVKRARLTAAVFLSMLHVETVCLELDGLVDATGLPLERVAERCPTLRALDLGGANLKDEELARVLDGHMHLEKLSLLRHRTLRDQVLVRVLRCCTGHMLELDLRSCCLLTDESLRCIGAHCGALSILRLDGADRCTAAGVKALRGLRTLTRLSLKGCRRVWELPVAQPSSLITSADEPQLWPLLAELDVKSLAQVPHEQWEALFLQPPSRPLVALKLGECAASRRCLLGVVTGVGSHTLRTLDLSWCAESLRAADAAFAAAACTSLEVLRLRCFDDLGDEDLVRIAASCTKLRKLNLARCPKVSDVGILALAKYLHSTLKSVDLSWTDGTDVGVCELLRGCVLLHVASFAGLKALTPAIAQSLVDSPCLSWVDLSWCNCASSALASMMVGKKKNLVVLDYYAEEIRGSDV